MYAAIGKRLLPFFHREEISFLLYPILLMQLPLRTDKDNHRQKVTLPTFSPSQSDSSLCPSSYPSGFRMRSSVALATFILIGKKTAPTKNLPSGLSLPLLSPGLPTQGHRILKVLLRELFFRSHKVCFPARKGVPGISNIPTHLSPLPDPYCLYEQLT